MGDGDGALLPVQLHQFRIGDDLGLDDGRGDKRWLLFVKALVGLLFVEALVLLG